MFRGIPVREAQASIHVQPNQRDIDQATKESPTNCAYARCLRRVLEAPNVFVFKRTAYIQTLNERGEPVMQRYLVKSYAREYIMRFDSGDKVAPGGFVFHRPNRSQTLVYKQKSQEKRWKAGKRSPRLTKGQKPKQREFSLREGRGRIHFFGSEDQIKAP
jgi:hypothetical protein